MTHLGMGPGGNGNTTLPWHLPYLQGQPHAVDIPNHAVPLLLLIQEAVAHCPKCLLEQIPHVLELHVVVDAGQRQCHHSLGVCGILESPPRLRADPRSENMGAGGFLTHGELALRAQHLLGQGHRWPLSTARLSQAQGQGVQAHAVQGSFGNTLGL